MIHACTSAQFTLPLNVYQNRPSTTTDAKIKKISLAIFGSLTLLVGHFLYSIGAPIPTLLAIPLFIAGGLMLWQLTKVKDYEDPATLQAYRMQAQSMSLSEIEYMHTRQNMLRYEIPAKSDFSRIYRAEMKSKTFAEINLYFEAYKTSKFNVPPPKEFKTTFERETKELTACEVFERYNIEKLHTYEVVSDRFYNDWKSFAGFCKKHEEKHTGAQTDYDLKAKKALSTFQPVLDQASGDNPSRQAWIEQLKREGALLASVPANRWPRETLNIMTPPTIPDGDTVAESLSPLFEAHKFFIAEITAAKVLFDGQKKILEEAMASRKLGINQHHSNEFKAP